MSEPRAEPGWASGFLAVVRYELLWNLRKRKFLGMVLVGFALATLSLAGARILSSLTGRALEPNPDYVVTSNLGLAGLGFFLFAVVTVMNSVSGEFESGTIVPLLSKPVSRTTVFLGKLFSAFLTLLGTYSLLTVYLAVGGRLVYGPQNNLHLFPLALLGNLLSTLVWIAIVLALGSVSRSSLIAALGAFAVWMGTGVVGGLLSVFSDLGWGFTYVPGSGTTGYTKVGGQLPSVTPGMRGQVSTGTDSVGSNLVNYILNPSMEVAICKMGFTHPGGPTGGFQLIELYSEPLSLILLRAVALALVYFTVFTLVAWYSFKRAQVTE